MYASSTRFVPLRPLSRAHGSGPQSPHGDCDSPTIEALGILGIEAGAAELTRLARAQLAALVVAKYRWKAVIARRRAPQLLGAAAAQKSIKILQLDKHHPKQL